MNKEKLVAFIKQTRDAATDNIALQGMELYPLYDDIKGTWQKKGCKCRYEVNGEMHLFKLTCEDQTEQGTFIVENWTPTEAASIWTAIDETHSGTIDDPIPYDPNMVVYNGLYYTYDGVLYKCIRDSGNPLYAEPSSLIGNYFEVIE